MILLPIFADQPSNAALMKKLGVGIHLNVQELTEAKLLEAVKEVISNQTLDIISQIFLNLFFSNYLNFWAVDCRYHLSMKQLSRAFKDDPKSPEELVVHWTEYVLRHKGTTFMKSVTVDIAWYQYLLMDVFIFVVVVSVFIVACMRVFVKYVIFLGFRFFKKVKFNEKK